MLFAVAFIVLLALLALFQLALALGAPWGRLSWGGQHVGTLPTAYRIASAFSIFIYGFIAALALGQIGIGKVFSEGFTQLGMWVVFGYLTLGALMNALSRSKPERFVMTPVALALAILALVLALSGPASGATMHG